ncbi:MAG: sugar ABC transporter permease [Hyphomicrobiales bacterium]|nr:sugar ABC transporter permease [Hyphomicrobiales bacterium]
MTQSTETRSEPATAQEGAITRFLRATEIDTRLLGMIGALILIWIGFQLAGEWRTGNGVFLTPRNLWILLVQTASIAVMTTGMVLIIVMRHIDLSVGSLLAFVAVVMGYSQVYILGPWLGVGHPAIWIISIIIGLCTGALIGAFHGFLISYAGIPSFIVTLGGLIVWRGAAWAVIRGETVAPMDETFELLGGGPFYSSIGASASWAIGVLICIAIVFALRSGRQSRKKFKFPLRPMWAEIFLGLVGCALALGTVWLVNSYYFPPKLANEYAQTHNIPIPEGGLLISRGFTIPVLIAVTAGLIMTFVATRTRFGRYIYAIGGNPEAAELAGINTKRMTLYMFTIMGILAAVSACISSARLNAASNALGLFDELYVIAATVIGGTSLAGGVGTIYGAMLGALVMQSLQSGMTLLNFDSAYKDMAVGSVLVLAVWLDQIYRRRAN